MALNLMNPVIGFRRKGVNILLIKLREMIK